LRRPRGEVSQSFQIAPFDDYYYYANSSSDVTQFDTSISHWNTYKGGVYQQAVSSLAYVNNENYQLEGKGFGIYGSFVCYLSRLSLTRRLRDVQ